MDVHKGIGMWSAQRGTLCHHQSSPGPGKGKIPSSAHAWRDTRHPGRNLLGSGANALGFGGKGAAAEGADGK